MGLYSQISGKAIIVSAPSGAGKTTIVHHLLKTFPQLSFSVSACSRERRGGEVDGKDYYFLGLEGFRKAIAEERFVEYEEVYANTYYGTLKSEVERIWAEKQVVIFDVDVVGGLHLKEKLGAQALSVFVKAPSVDVLEARLQSRQTDTPEKIAIRIAKAKYEMSFETRFDRVLVNQDLALAFAEAERMVQHFLSN